MIAPVLLAVLAVTAPTPQDVRSVVPPFDVAESLAVQVLVTARIEAVGVWEYDAPEISVIPAPPPPPRVYVPKNYGPPPPLTGPILKTAERYLGIAYVWGGNSPSEGFDCSGLVQYVYAVNGISVPRTVDGLRSAGTVTTHPKPGDVILTAHHAALYVAPGWMLDAPHAGEVVQVRPMWQTSPIYVTFTG